MIIDYDYILQIQQILLLMTFIMAIMVMVMILLDDDHIGQHDDGGTELIHHQTSNWTLHWPNTS